MSNRILSRSAIVLGLLSALSAAPALAAENILVLHDEADSGPVVVQSAPQKVAQGAASAQTAAAPHEEVVLRGEGMTAPEVRFH